MAQIAMQFDGKRTVSSVPTETSAAGAARFVSSAMAGDRSNATTVNPASQNAAAATPAPQPTSTMVPVVNPRACNLARMAVAARAPKSPKSRPWMTASGVS